jgi:formamidopyrimidine-DNA glycosylase
MPEGVEIRLFAEEISVRITGKPLIAIKILSGRYAKESIVGLRLFKQKLPLVIESVGVRGKFMWWQFKSTPKTKVMFLATTLGMAGGWTTFKTKYNRIKFTFGSEPATKLYLFDVRNFATVKVMTHDQFNAKLSKLGPDMFSREWTSSKFALSIKNISSAISTVLLSQKIVAGPGAYIIAEALYLAKIHPGTSASKLSPGEISRLFNTIRDVAARSYRANRTHISIYKLTDDISVINKFKFNIYKKKTDPLGNPVKSYRSGDRSIKWVPRIQKIK